MKGNKRKSTKVQSNEMNAKGKKISNRRNKNYIDKDLSNEDKKLISDRVEEKLKNHSKYGNPNWYFTDKDLAEQASRFSFQSYIGNGDLTEQAKLPSICTIALNPSLGGYVGATQDLDPIEENASLQAINLCARKLYSTLSMNSGRTPSYQPQDVIFSILGVGEIISLVSHLRRVIGLAFTYNYRNRDFPSHVIKALGVNPDDLFSNLAKYRVTFNTILNMANKIPILSNITWFNKCSSIYEGIFQDSPDEMAQMYAFVPSSTWVLNEGSEYGTILETTPVYSNYGNALSANYKTFGEYLTILQTMISALLTSSTYNIIYADILRLAEKNEVSLFQLDLIDENYAVVPQYDEEVLLHIHNMNILNISEASRFPNEINNLQGRSTSSCNDVFQDPGSNNVIYAPVFRFYGSNFLTDTETMDQISNIIKYSDIVDFPYGNPDLTERLEATRFSTRLNSSELIDEDENHTRYLLAMTLPDHYPVKLHIWTNGSTVNNASNSVFQTMKLQDDPSDSNIGCNLSKFRYAPLMYIYTTTGHIKNVIGDINYFTHLDGEWLKRLNSLCLQGLFELRS